ncbi:nicotinate-nucleotide--dimethylbenzimidazole phosphoribosyltransferase [Rhizoclosmatium globosum]|uniref:Nicotinate-nucleotide--dimethylbenzimidazole phosphoribosyltransferase n=1 Tax=Rhizoclosmatium globosum TaxID=329046 RepID=A0A1Y2CK75_9FUNG|nr:nicotinate-nucleotide--dimethylbenzimidazole phosphoribosyltransferase [Rhizoclosmatium globosum]|eukprot:ORY46745.1 nicotinate-nucleotide--dimethylbenzimidazole phosphoribosyltransferase [Rhizoclosmatium globosum]
MTSHAEWTAKAQAEIDNKTKPVGSLGRLEQWSVRLMALQQTLKPIINNGHVLLFAADHGIADDGVSQFPKVVTREMLRNLSSGGAAINAICNANALKLSVIDVGVDTDETFTGIHVAKDIAPHGTNSSLRGPAMTDAQLDAALSAGIEYANAAIDSGAQAIAIGELGIGNTAVAAILLAAVSGKSAAQVTGKGTGVEGERYDHKVKVVEQVLEKHNDVIKSREWREMFKCLGGLEIAAMAGAAVAVARSPKKPALLVDGYISMVAFLFAIHLFPAEKELLGHCAFLSHASAESGTRIAITEIEKALGVSEGGMTPMLDIGFRLGEGTGAALVFPILKAAGHIASDMNTFAGADVSGSN